MRKEIVPVPGWPVPRPLSRAVRFGNLVFVAGMGGRDPRTNEIVSEDFAAQTRQTLENIKSALHATGLTMQDVLKTTCYLKDIADKKVFDEIYSTYFPTDPPARACFQIVTMSPGIKVEIETIAGIPS